MTDLNPCPFCGSEAMFTVEQREDHPDVGGHSAMCGSCGAGVGYIFACGEDPRPRLAELWNKRTAPPKEIAVAAQHFVENHYSGPLHMARQVFDWVHGLKGTKNG